MISHNLNYLLLINFYFLFNLNNFFVIIQLFRILYKTIKVNILTIYSNAFICSNYFCNKITCSICLDIINNGNYAKVMCGHQFCTSCLCEWSHINNTCPICRFIIFEKQPTINNNNFERNVIHPNFRARRRNAILLNNDAEYQQFVRIYINNNENNNNENSNNEIYELPD